MALPGFSRQRPKILRRNRIGKSQKKPKTLKRSRIREEKKTETFFGGFSGRTNRTPISIQLIGGARSRECGVWAEKQSNAAEISQYICWAWRGKKVPWNFPHKKITGERFQIIDREFQTSKFACNLAWSSLLTIFHSKGIVWRFIRYISYFIISFIIVQSLWHGGRIYCAKGLLFVHSSSVKLVLATALV